jgi:flagellar basal-body rod protein FlgB
MLGDLPFFSALRTQMKWHAARQSVLAENIANADTPGFQARDLVRVDHERRVDVPRSGGVAAVRTDSKHLSSAPVSLSQSSQFEGRRQETFEVTPEGNSVVLEEEVMKMTANQLDYQTVSSLYQKSLSMLRTAVGRR